MLSGETANGMFPVAAVNMMARVCREAEAVTNYDQLFRAIRTSTMEELDGPVGVPESVRFRCAFLCSVRTGIVTMSLCACLHRRLRRRL